MSKQHAHFTLILFILIVAGVAYSGAHFQPGEWYAHLEKPGWTPPNWIFPPVWGALYVMIAIAGWLIFSLDGRTLQTLWILQLVLNGLWSWLFFGLHQTGLALVDILAMFTCIGSILALSYKASTPVFWLMAPYLAWVGYASTLNAAIYFLNPA
jgi:tryptophan-rich sensory protein